MSAHLILWVTGAVVFLFGVVMLATARASDFHNYIIERATPMPLALVNERDDVWLRGLAVCDRPLLVPHFKFPCAYFRYELEELVEHVRRTKRGFTTYYTWEIRLALSKKVANIRLQDGGHSIIVPLDEAELDDLPKKVERVGKWRHSAVYLPVPSVVSAVGSVGPGRERLERFANIPLIVTLKEREEYVRLLESGEKLLRFFGFLSLWCGAAAGFYGLFDKLWPLRAGGFNLRALGYAAAIATAIFVPVWVLYIYNTFVTYEVRVENAWRQIDVDLKMRYDLIPQLVAAVKGFMKHERELLEKLTRMRSEALARGRASEFASEGEVSGLLREFMLSVERYPELRSQPLVAKLMHQIMALEDKIAHGRTIYNEAVREYNANVLSFPRMLLAKLCGFARKDFFELEGRRVS